MKAIENRHSKILEDLSRAGRMEVTALALNYQVSVVTMRKDLAELEERGLLRREQGFAILEENDMKRRLAANHATKCRLAKRAAQLVDDGEIVMIESGSCCILLAEEICRTKKDVTIVTNSVFMTDYIGRMQSVRLVLLGGDYQRDSQAVVGPVTRASAQLFHVSRLFAGTDGYLSGVGFTGDNHLRVETIRNMAENAEETVILTESLKFLHRGVVPLFRAGEVGCVVTDSSAEQSVQDELKKEGIKLMLI